MTSKKIKLKLNLMTIALLIIIVLAVFNLFHFIIVNIIIISIFLVCALTLYSFHIFYFENKTIDIYKQKRDILFKVIDYFSIFIYIIFILQMIFNFIMFPAIVNQTSMNPNLYEGDRIIVINNNENIDRFDIVVFKIDTNIQNTLHASDEGSLWIKRVIGLPGERIDYVNGQLFVNNQEVYEQYLYNINGEFHYGSYVDENGKSSPYNTRTSDFTFESILNISRLAGDVIPEDYYLVLGDNRQFSLDSTEIGLIHKSQIIGEGKFLMKNLVNWEKIGD